MDIKLTEGDMDVSAGDLVLIAGMDAIRQHLTIRLGFFLGEWFLNTLLGVPYYEQVFIKIPNTNAVRAIFREVIEETPGVIQCNDLVLDYDGATRALSVSFSAQVTGSDTPLDYSHAFIVGGT